MLSRFLSKCERPEDPTACWLWAGAKSTAGYGYIRDDPANGGRAVPAHRVAYQLFVGAIPNGLELDHLCRTPGCVNPRHLEPVSHSVNVARGESIPARFARRSHCPAGHDLRAPGALIFKATGNTRRASRCRLCHNNWTLQRYYSRHDGIRFNHRVTQAHVARIVVLRTMRQTIKEIAANVELPRGTVESILGGRRWSWLTGLSPDANGSGSTNPRRASPR